MLNRFPLMSNYYADLWHTAKGDVSPKMIKCYLAVIRHAQIALGLQDPPISRMAKLEQVPSIMKRLRKENIAISKIQANLCLKIAFCCPALTKYRCTKDYCATKCLCMRVETRNRNLLSHAIFS